MSSPYPVLNNRPIDHWKVTELKEELRKRKLTIKGLKEDLVKRLRDAIYEEIDELKRQELNNVPNQESDQKEQYVEDLPDPMGSGLIDVLHTGKQSTNNDSDSKRSENESEKTQNTGNVSEGNKAPAKEFVTTTDLNASLEEECPAVPMESDELSVLASETKTIQHPVCVETTDAKADQEMDEKNKELQSVTEDFTLNHSEPKNQVSEVKPSLGLQVNCESISTDSVSINEKNELKDNLNADNFHLELEVVKTELVHSSSTDVAPIGGDLHSSDNVQDPGDNQGPDEMVDVLKTDNVDVGYSEKLNLDRSSGDESMEEDVLESKQIQSNAVPEVVESSIDLEVVHTGSTELSPPKNNVVAEDVEKPLISSEKRKHEEKEPYRSNEPFKRQRRWITEAQRVHEQQVSNLTSLDTPINSCSFTPKRTFVRSDSNMSGEGGDSQKERTVPPSLKPPTNSLRIDRFLRPFTLKAVQELLGKTGTVCTFWMDNIKTHCYVTYSSEEEAAETRNAIFNLQWPPNGGRLLVAEFVDPQEVKNHVDTPLDSSLPMSSPISISPSTQLNQLSRQKSLKKQLPPSPALPVAPPSKEHLAPSHTIKESEPPLLTLDELFMKTKSTPRIYYLPLTEEQVSAKKARQVRD